MGLNGLKWKMNEKKIKLLLRQRFNNKIGYTLWSKTHIVLLLPEIHRPTCTLLTAQSFNCTDMRFLLILDTHSLTQSYSADRTGPLPPKSGLAAERSGSKSQMSGAER